MPYHQLNDLPPLITVWGPQPLKLCALTILYYLNLPVHRFGRLHSPGSSHFVKRCEIKISRYQNRPSCCLALVFPIAKLQSETRKDAARYLWDFSGNSADFCYLRVLSGKLWCSYMIFYLDDSWENVWVDGWTAMEGDLRTCLQADIRCRIWYPPSLAACQACHLHHHEKSFPYMDINTNFLLISTNFAGFWG